VKIKCVASWCPFCGVKTTAANCDGCGEMLNHWPASGVCPYCGYNDSGRVLCPCGRYYSESDVEKEYYEIDSANL